MKPKHYISILSAILMLFISFFLTGCFNLGYIDKIEMKNKETIEVVAGDFSYEGISVIVYYSSGATKEINLTESMISEADKLNFYKMGEHDIKVVYTPRITTTMKINVVRNEFDDIYDLEDYTCIYDGKPHKIEINYELPEGAKIEYPYGNTFTNAGEYNIVGVISKSGYNSKTLNATLTIKKAEADLSGVEFNDQTYVYDGEAKTIEAKNVPSDIEVEYEVYNEDKSVKLNNTIINSGVYVIVANFKSKNENVEEIPSKEAKLTILKAKYDMSSVRLEDHTKEYDGQEYNAKLTADSNLPQDVEVSYKYYNLDGIEVNSNINSGEYKMVASFESKNANYDAIEPIEAKLVVNKKLVSLDGLITFNSKTVKYDREVHSIFIDGTLPKGVSVEYTNNEKKAAGWYVVEANFTIDDPNEYLDITNLQTYLIINKIREEVMVVDQSGEEKVLTKDNIEFTINSQTDERKIKINGFNEDVYEISEFVFTEYDDDSKVVDIDSFEDGKKYNFRIEMEFIDADDRASVLLSPVIGTFSCDITFEDDLKLNDIEIVYDGSPHGLAINKELPVGTLVEYPEGEEKTDVGTYTIKWILKKNTYRTKELTGTLTIAKATYDMSSVEVKDVVKTYDGNDYIPEYDLPTGVTIDEVKFYLPNGDEWPENKEIGDYKIVVTFKGDELNYNPISPIEFNLKVEMKVYDLSNIKLDNISLIVFNNQFKGVYALISGTPRDQDGNVDWAEPYVIKRSTDLPEGVNVSYEVRIKKYSETDVVTINGQTFNDGDILFTIDTNGVIHPKDDNPVFGVIKAIGKYEVTALFTVVDDKNTAVNVDKLVCTVELKMPD